MKRRKLVLKIRRKINEAGNALHSRCHTVSCDSVFGLEPNTARLTNVRSSPREGYLRVELRWEQRDTWDMEINGQSFQIYHTASHKYWLRGLIRRCR
jgi:hypothetical protein